MKKIIIYLTLFFIIGTTTYAQESSFKLKNNGVYRAIINGNIEQYIGDMNDSSLIISKSPQVFGQGLGKVYKYNEIENIGIIRKGSPGRGVLIGAITGAVAGTIVGLVSYQKPEPNPDIWFTFDFGPAASALVGGILGIVPGGLIGLAIGSGKHQYTIGKQKQAFSDMYAQIAGKIDER